MSVLTVNINGAGRLSRLCISSAGVPGIQRILTKMKYPWTIAATLLCLIAGSVQAETWEQKVDRHFALLDIDGDGAISRKEAAAHPPLSRHFRNMDKNKDGGLSKYELANYRTAPRNRSLAKADSATKGGQTSGSTE
jgi:Ca2+-binding EF-hand superfamily protein